MDGQAQAPESNSVEDLASYLSDTPETESEEELPAEESPETDNDLEAEPQTDEESEEEVEEETETEAKEAKPTTEEIEVTVKGDDGSDTTIKVSKEELVKGYHRQADYTRKTQALAERESQAVQVFREKHEIMRDTYLQRTELATQAIVQMAGFRSDAEMAQLAATDPSAWVQENQRQNQIRQLLGTLENQTQAERQQSAVAAQNYEAMQLEKVKSQSWAELQKVGVDEPKLRATYQTIMKNYGYEAKDFATVTDHRLVKIMMDANAYRELKAKAPAVTQQAKAAPRMHTKQTTAASTRQSQAIDAKFNSGKAKRQDLASFMRTL